MNIHCYQPCKSTVGCQLYAAAAFAHLVIETFNVSEPTITNSLVTVLATVNSTPKLFRLDCRGHYAHNNAPANGEVDLPSEGTWTLVTKLLRSDNCANRVIKLTFTHPHPSNNIRSIQITMPVRSTYDKALTRAVQNAICEAKIIHETQLDAQEIIAAAKSESEAASLKAAAMVAEIAEASSTRRNCIIFVLKVAAAPFYWVLASCIWILVNLLLWCLNPSSKHSRHDGGRQNKTSLDMDR